MVNVGSVSSVSTTILMKDFCSMSFLLTLISQYYGVNEHMKDHIFELRRKILIYD